MKNIALGGLWTLCFLGAKAQTNWVSLDSLYQPLPSSMHVFKSAGPVEGRPNIMYYAIADLGDKGLDFTCDTTLQRRLTPDQYYVKDKSPLLVVNGSFFSFATNKNLNVVVKDGKMVAYNEQTIAGKGKDTLTYFHSFFGALGISKKRVPDVAWVYTDSASDHIFASQSPVHFLKDSLKDIDLGYVKKRSKKEFRSPARFSKWKMETAVGGGPVLLQQGEIKITNNEERKFAGKALHNHEPRTAIGYTRDNKLIILVCEGRSADAAGLTLDQLAKIFKDLGCVEAINLDGGGSSCMLINGKEVNHPSTKGIQRPVPSVFVIRRS